MLLLHTLSVKWPQKSSISYVYLRIITRYIYMEKKIKLLPIPGLLKLCKFKHLPQTYSKYYNIKHQN